MVPVETLTLANQALIMRALAEGASNPTTYRALLTAVNRTEEAIRSINAEASAPATKIIDKGEI